MRETECRYIRSDTLIVLAGASARRWSLVVADWLVKFGGDHVSDTRAALDHYLSRIPWQGRRSRRVLAEPPSTRPEPVEAPAEET